MIRRCGFAVSALLLLCAPASAIIPFVYSDDVSDREMRARITRQMFGLKNPTGDAFRRQSERMHALRMRFWKSEPKVVALLGAKVEKAPRTFALSVYDSGGLGLSGLMSLQKFRTQKTPELNKAHVDFYAIEEFAGVEVAYKSDGVTPSYTVLYFRADETYSALNHWRDLKARMAWDDARLARLEAWLDARQKS